MLQELEKKLDTLEQNDKYLIKSVNELQKAVFTEKLSYNTNEAAHALGVEPNTIREWVKSGKLIATKTGKKILIHAKSLKQVLENHE